MNDTNGFTIDRGFTHECPVCAEPIKIAGRYPRTENRNGENFIEHYLKVICHKCGNTVQPREIEVETIL